MRQKYLFGSMILLFLLASAVVYCSLPPMIKVDRPDPTITIQFNENVTLVSYELKKSSGQSIDLLDPVSNDNKVFNFSPENWLVEGVYVFLVEANDSFGNSGQKQQFSFEVELAGPEISYVTPRHGAAITRVFNVTLRSTHKSECRLAAVSSGISDFDRMPKFDLTGNRELHTKLNYDGVEPGRVHPYYVVCKNIYNQTSDAYVFNFSYDPSPPVISAKASPNPVIEVSYFTRLIIDSDDLVVCKYSDIDVPFGQMSFFEGNNDSMLSSYSKHKEQLMTGLSEGNHSYYVQCLNPSGNLSNRKKVAVLVDTSIAGMLQILRPDGVSRNTTVVIEAKTTKDATCWYGNTTEPELLGIQTGTFGPPGARKDFKSIPMIYSSGIYRIYVKCFFAGGTSLIDERGFVIDTIPAGKPVVNDTSTVWNAPEQSYHTDRIRVKWYSEDRHSGIDVYEYKVEDSFGEIIVNWTKSSSHNRWKWIRTDEEGVKLNLTPGNTYYVFARAIDNAGNSWSEIGKSDGVTINISLRPSFASCTDGVKNQDETDIDCGGVCGPVCNINQSCGYNDSNCRSGRCQFNVCKELPTCQNQVWDPGESDIDCGGSCSPCSFGESCLNHSDCSTGFCSQQTCTVPTCDDGIKNNGETDVDCGGYMCDERCADAMACAENGDCLSSICKDQSCVASTCDDGVKNQGEEQIDCGGLNCPECLAYNSCNDDDDCEFGNYCEDSVCRDVDRKDSDGDGMTDLCEEAAGLDKFDSNDAELDQDEDGLPNREEVWSKDCSLNTDPFNRDSDRDGYDDSIEIELGFDPLDPDSHPTSNFLIILLVILGIIAVLAIVGFFGYRAYKDQETKKQSYSVKTPVMVQPKMRTSAPTEKKMTDAQKKLLDHWRQQQDDRKNLRTHLFDQFMTPEQKRRAILKQKKKKELKEVNDQDDGWLNLSDVANKIKQFPKDQIAVAGDAFNKLGNIITGKKSFDKLSSMKTEEKVSEPNKKADSVDGLRGKSDKDLKAISEIAGKKMDGALKDQDKNIKTAGDAFDALSKFEERGDMFSELGVLGAGTSKKEVVDHLAKVSKSKKLTSKMLKKKLDSLGKAKDDDVLEVLMGLRSKGAISKEEAADIIEELRGKK